MAYNVNQITGLIERESMSDPQIVEQIWVSVAEGAERTGFHPDHVRRLARENWRLPENKRTIRIHKPSREYAIWLPDLVNYSLRQMPFEADPEQFPADQMWVNTNEASELTGYNHKYLIQLASKCWKIPEDERPIQMLNRSGRYEFWLPDLIKYFAQPGHGPQRKRT